MSTIVDCFFFHHDGKFCVFFFFVFKNTGLVFRVLAALAWDLPVNLLGKLQPNSEAAVRQDWPGWNLLDLPIPTARSATRTYIPKGLMYLKWSPFQPLVTHFCWFNISLPEALSFEKGCFLAFLLSFSVFVFSTGGSWSVFVTRPLNWETESLCFITWPRGYWGKSQSELSER